MTKEATMSPFIFQSTLPRRERPFRILHTISIKYFNPRSREGSDFVPRYHRSMPQYFNPRSREGSDTTPPVTLKAPSISIHAPAKGATAYVNAQFAWSEISIHAPAKGATGIGLPQPNRISFQSTLPRRERHSSLLRLACSHAISIHAPAKGATVLHSFCF